MVHLNKNHLFVINIIVDILSRVHHATFRSGVVLRCLSSVGVEERRADSRTVDRDSYRLTLLFILHADAFKEGGVIKEGSQSGVGGQGTELS